MPEITSQNNPEQLEIPFDINVALDTIASETQRLRAELGQGTDGRPYPEWWNPQELTNTREVEQYLRGDSSTPDQVARYWDSAQQRSDIRKQVSGYDQDPIMRALADEFSLGPAGVAKGLRAESEYGNSMRSNLLESLGDEKACVAQELVILKAYYGVSSPTGLLAVDGKGFDGDVSRAILTENSIRWIRAADNKYDPEVKWGENTIAARTWMSQALSIAANIPESEAKNYSYSAVLKQNNASILSVFEKFKQLGPERIRKISDKTGIHGLESYSVEQLERMEQYVTAPAEMAEALKDKDVTLVLINRVGDHNGVLLDTAEKFDDGQGATLFFEFAHLADVPRTILKLKQAGIQPSNVVLSAHSSEGQFIVSDERATDEKKYQIATIAAEKMVALANAGEGIEKGYEGFSIDGMDGLARLIDECMKPGSRDGAKKIIFNACHMGSEAPIFGTDENGEKIEIGRASIISKLAEKLQSLGTTSDVEIFGGEGGIQMHRTEMGVKYSGKVKNWDEGRSTLHATKVSISNGEVTQQNVEEIVLRG